MCRALVGNAAGRSNKRNRPISTRCASHVSVTVSITSRLSGAVPASPRSCTLTSRSTLPIRNPDSPPRRDPRRTRRSLPALLRIQASFRPRLEAGQPPTPREPHMIPDADATPAFFLMRCSVRSKLCGRIPQPLPCREARPTPIPRSQRYRNDIPPVPLAIKDAPAYCDSVPRDKSGLQRHPQIESHTIHTECDPARQTPPTVPSPRSSQAHPSVRATAHIHPKLCRPPRLLI